MKLSFLLAALLVASPTSRADDDDVDIASGGILTQIFTPEVINRAVEKAFSVFEFKIKLFALLKRLATFENLRQGLGLARKTLNFVMRLSDFLLRYLPAPQPDGDYLQNALFPQVDLPKDFEPDPAEEPVTQKPLGDVFADEDVDQDTLTKLIFGQPPDQSKK